MSNDFESFKSKSVTLLDLSFYSYIALILIGLIFAITILPSNVQNFLPLILLLFLGLFTWIIRLKISSSTEEQFKEIKQVLMQWFGLTVVFMSFTILVVLLYPQG